VYFKFENFQNFDKSYEKENKEYEEKYQAALHGYRGPYIDAFCQVWFHLAQLFQRSRIKYEKVNGRTTDAK
jgi:hypothetical protein